MTGELVSVGENLKTFLYLLEDKIGHAKVNCAERLQALRWDCFLSAWGSFDSKVQASLKLSLPCGLHLYLFEHYFDSIIQTVSSTAFHSHILGHLPLTFF